MATLLAPSRADRAFERLYRRYVADVYRYVLAVLHNRADAEDAAQTVFLSAYRAYERGERPERPLNWLMTIAHNVCRQRFRESARRPRLVELADEVPARAASEETPNAEDIRRALGFLAFNQRAALVMRELQGRSYDEIGAILGLSTSAVETLLFRARRALREQLEGALTCGEAELALSRRADGRLTRSERGPLRAHLRECHECAALERRLRLRTRALRSIGLPIPSSLGSFFSAGGTAGTGVGAKAAAVVVAGVIGSSLAGGDPVAPVGAAPAAPATAVTAKTAPNAAPASNQVRGERAKIRRSSAVQRGKAARGRASALRATPVSAGQTAEAAPSGEAPGVPLPNADVASSSPSPAAPEEESGTAPAPAAPEASPRADVPVTVPEARVTVPPASPPAAPPVTVPPVTTSPVNVPPAKVPPVSLPPAKVPPVNVPPAKVPPVNVPPNVPPVNVPPVTIPPVPQPVLPERAVPPVKLPEPVRAHVPPVPPAPLPAPAP